jgi:sensor histidine kinase YesM
MFGVKNLFGGKYLRIELIFLLFICYFSPIISDVEYSYYEEHNIWNFSASLEYRLVYGTFSLLFYGVFYWGFVKRFIFRKQVLYTVLTIIAFIILNHLYTKYVENWSISKMSFLSAGLRARALNDYQHTKLYFIVIYLLNRIVLVIVGFAFLIRSLKQDEEMNALKQEQLMSELHILKAQLHPHFFFNTLNNIYALALKQSADTAPLVSKLADMMRYILYEASLEKVNLSREIAFISNYISAEQIRHRQNISITFDVQGINEHDYIEPLLLLPFIENAFKHGIQDEVGKGFVQVLICRDEQTIALEVTNSKPLLQREGVSGIGLQNAVKRLDLLYPERYQLVVKEDDNIYQVNLNLQQV